MGRKYKTSPTLQLTITEEQKERAIESNSGGCLIADAIKSQYPQLSGISVDMTTIRVSDRKRGERYTYLTPPTAQHILLSFDQGWPNPSEELTVKGAVKITPITRSPKTAQQKRDQRDNRIAQLQAKQAAGETLDYGERRALTIMTNAKARGAPERPSREGREEVITDREGRIVIRGGRPIPQGPDHPNLLRGRNRIFGAKLADPGRAFHEAVEAAVIERLNAK